MINQPDKKLNMNNAVVPQEGQRRLLSGDNCVHRCPSLSFKTKQEMVAHFQYLYKRDYGVTLTFDEALELGMRLISLVTQINPELYQLKNYE